MAEPTCQKCGGHDFDYKGKGPLSSFYIIFCKDCGWIAGCVRA